MTLRHFTTAGALFISCILVTDLTIGILVVTSIGPRVRGGARLASAERVS
jgi:hypothetical protein